jgi:hypothetical protein
MPNGTVSWHGVVCDQVSRFAQEIGVAMRAADQRTLIKQTANRQMTVLNLTE